MSNPLSATAAAAWAGIAFVIIATLTVTACTSGVSCNLRDRPNPLRIILSEEWEPSDRVRVEADCDEESCIRKSQPGAAIWSANISDPSSFTEIRVRVLDENETVLLNEVMKINWNQREPEDRCDEPWAEADLVVSSR